MLKLLNYLADHVPADVINLSLEFAYVSTVRLYTMPAPGWIKGER